jgi:tetratricopeptide (TPR) repeat protein
VIGTPHYMAPEQAQASGEIDGRADIYALGILAFEAASGTLPFQGSTLVSLLKKHVLEPLPSLRDRCADCPEAVEAAIRKATEKRPEDRFQDAASFARELRRVYRGAFESPPPAAVPPAVDSQTSFYDAQQVREATAASLVQRALDGDLPGALRDLGRFGTEVVQDLTARLLTGVLGAGRADEVLRVEPELRAIAPRAPQALFFLARAYQQRGRFDDSIVLLMDAWRRNREDIEVAHELASTLAARGRKDEAEKVVAALVALRASDPRAHRRAAEVRYVALGDLTGAAASYGRAADLDATAYEPRQQQGFLLLELGRNEEAARALEDAVRRAPEAALAHQLLGRARALTGDSAGGRRAYARALELDPSASEARLVLLHNALEERRWLDAVRLAGEGLERNPSDRSLTLGLAFAREGLGEARVALRLYEALLQRDPRDPKAQIGFARCRKKSADPDDAPPAP